VREDCWTEITSIRKQRHLLLHRPKHHITQKTVEEHKRCDYSDSVWILAMPLSGKQLLRWRSMCQRFVRKCSWDQQLWRVGQGVGEVDLRKRGTELWIRPKVRCNYIQLLSLHPTFEGGMPFQHRPWQGQEVKFFMPPCS
jgi:hypothetical protein